MFTQSKRDMTATTAQWREVLKDRVYALYVYDHHRVAIAQMLDDESNWVVTVPDNPTAKHPAKSRDDAFKIGKKVSVAWLQGALKQLASVDPNLRTMTTAEVQADIKARKQQSAR